MWDNQLASWQRSFASYGWISSPLLFGAHQEFARDDPAAVAQNPSVTKSLSVGIPHPQYGIMRATAFLTSARSLTRLVNVVHQAATVDYRAADGLPHLYLGTRPFVDRVGDRECGVLGILVYEGSCALDVQYAAVTVARWQATWLPYFEDANNWVMTGWDCAGRVTEIFKPFGWGCQLLEARPGTGSSVQSKQDCCGEGEVTLGSCTGSRVSKTVEIVL